MHPENEFCILYQEMTRRTAALMQESFIRHASSLSTASSEKYRNKRVPGATLKMSTAWALT
jgi:hypothetical protein